MVVRNEQLRSCIQGDRRAQHDLYKLCFGFLMSICFRYTNSRDDAVSLLNQGFLKVIMNLKKYQPHIPFELWIRRIMINTIIDEFRKKKRDREVLEFTDFSNYHEYDGAFVMNEVENKINIEDLQECISKLPEKSRKVFNLYAIDGYSHKEIANLLEMSEGNSKWHLSTARQKLKEMIEGLITDNKSI